MEKIKFKGYKQAENENSISNSFWDWLFNKILENRKKNLTTFKNEKYVERQLSSNFSESDIL